MLSNPSVSLTEDQVLDYVYEDMFFDSDCPFETCYADEICIDVEDLYFKNSTIVNAILSDVFNTKTCIDFEKLKVYVSKNDELLKTHFNYSIGSHLDDKTTKDLFIDFVKKSCWN